MAQKKKDPEATADEAVNAAEDAAEETVAEDWPDEGEGDDMRNVWMRGLFMLILAVLMHVAEWLLVVLAVLQFLWLLFSKEKNEVLLGTGDTIGRWMLATARFQTGASEVKPFPWRRLD